MPPVFESNGLNNLAAFLKSQNQLAEAEPLLRECLVIREKMQPDAWITFDTKSMLGGALLGQKKYAESEPLLLSGLEGMKEREATVAS
jgi:eukaryotic-like serine/threonine-protein kinase